MAVWVIRGGRNGEREEEALDNNVLTIGFGYADDLSKAKTLEDVAGEIQKFIPSATSNQIASWSRQLWSFKSRIEIGDLIVMPRKGQPFVAIGTMTEAYAFRPDMQELCHGRVVEWINREVSRDILAQDLKRSLSADMTVFQPRASAAEDRLRAIASGQQSGGVPGVVHESGEEGEWEGGQREPEPEIPYDVDDIINEGCFLERARLETMLERLRTKKNLILQGPPGTGKTWLAKKLAFALIGNRSDRRVRPFQFHPNLSYEDFVRGWRPGGGGLLELVDGPLLQAIDVAKNDPPNDYVVVIEEINRGNPAQIFGEMLTLLEADKRTHEEALALSYPRGPRERVHIPPNLYVIGTMNVADRSLALVDLALRRRFSFIDLEPTFGDRWRTWVSEQFNIDAEFLVDIERRLTSLNRTIEEDATLGPQFRVGHSVVTPTGATPIDNPGKWFRQVAETEIGPLLDEYWFDNLETAKSERERLLQDLAQ